MKRCLAHIYVMHDRYFCFTFPQLSILMNAFVTFLICKTKKEKVYYDKLYGTVVWELIALDERFSEKRE